MSDPQSIGKIKGDIILPFLEINFFSPQGGSTRVSVRNFIKYGQYRSFKVNHSQLRLI